MYRVEGLVLGRDPCDVIGCGFLLGEVLFNHLFKSLRVGACETLSQ